MSQAVFCGVCSQQTIGFAKPIAQNIRNLNRRFHFRQQTRCVQIISLTHKKRRRRRYFTPLVNCSLLSAMAHSALLFRNTNITAKY